MRLASPPPSRFAVALALAASCVAGCSPAQTCGTAGDRCDASAAADMTAEAPEERGCGGEGEACCPRAVPCDPDLACASGTCRAQRRGDIGRSCGDEADCAAGPCLPLGATAVCTAECKGAADCPAGWACELLAGQAATVCRCQPGPELCDGADNDCDGIVAGSRADAECALMKGEGTVCRPGGCTCLLTCRGACVDPGVDAAHCGACGAACTDGRACVNGACACPGLACDGACVDAMVDSSHCGACGRACAAAQDCTSGRCGRPDYEWARWPMPSSSGEGLPNPAAYDVSVAGIVRDVVTGLTWQRDVTPDAYARKEAAAYCASLALAGGGWRLPTRIELVSIVDLSRQAPAIDPAAFPDTPVARFWSASPPAGGPSFAWHVDFRFGNYNDYSVRADDALRVRCVR